MYIRDRMILIPLFKHVQKNDIKFYVGKKLFDFLPLENER